MLCTAPRQSAAAACWLAHSRQLMKPSSGCTGCSTERSTASSLSLEPVAPAQNARKRAESRRGKRTWLDAGNSTSHAGQSSANRQRKQNLCPEPAETEIRTQVLSDEGGLHARHHAEEVCSTEQHPLHDELAAEQRPARCMASGLHNHAESANGGSDAQHRGSHASMRYAESKLHSYRNATVPHTRRRSNVQRRSIVPVARILRDTSCVRASQKKERQNATASQQIGTHSWSGKRGAKKARAAERAGVPGCGRAVASAVAAARALTGEKRQRSEKLLCRESRTATKTVSACGALDSIAAKRKRGDAQEHRTE